MKSEEENFEYIVDGKHQKINSIFHSHRESRFRRLKLEEIKSLKKSKIEEIEVEEAEDI
jgi:hypothetical protein